MEVVGAAGNGLGEGFLLVGVARELDALAEEGGLHQAGAVVVGGDRAAPEVFVGDEEGGGAEVDDGL